MTASTRPASRLRLIPLAAFASVLAACGTTVPVTTAVSQGTGGTGFETTQPGQGPEGTTGGTGTGTSGTSLPGTTGVAIDGSSGSVTGGTIAGGATGATTGSSTFTCTKTLKIGVSYSSDFGAAVQAVSGTGAAEGGNYAETLKRLYAVGIDDLNKRGGIGGCKVALALHDFRVTAANGFDGQSQEECDDFADDQKVFAVYPAWFESKVLLSCLAGKGIPVFPGPGVTFYPTRKDFAKFRGILYGPSLLAVDRLGPVMNLFHENGFFSSSAKVGFLVDDDVEGNNRHLVEKIWKPRLAALKVPVASTFVYTHPNSVSSSGDTSAAMTSAVLQFRQAGVTHVITTPDSGGGVQLFTPVAHSQGYHPRLGVTSTSGAEIIQVTNGSTPAESKVGAMAVSWTLFDFAGDASNSWVRNPSNPQRDHCLSLYRKEAAANKLSMPSLFPWCDTLEVLWEATRGATAVPTVTSLLEGVDRLGTRIRSSTGYGAIRFAPGHYDGGDTVRVMSWNDDTALWDYRTKPTVLP